MSRNTQQHELGRLADRLNAIISLLQKPRVTKDERVMGAAIIESVQSGLDELREALATEAQTN